MVNLKRRYLTPLLVAASFLSAAGSAQASGDSCDPGWNLDFAGKPSCENISALVPGNDTRANLLLLLADRHGVKASDAPAPRPTLDWPEFRLRSDGGAGVEPASAFAEGEGSRCRSNETGDKAFAAAVAAAEGLSADERTSLVAARSRLGPNCTDGAGASTGMPPVAATSPGGRAFAAYLIAADAFYAGRFDDAAKGFAALASAPDPWVSETAAYMAARNAVNAIQVGAYDEYGVFKGSTAIDQSRARAAESGLDAYLVAHPQGRYAASARGLKRRVYWLAGWTDRLTAAYAAMIAQTAAARGLSDADLADEIDSKLLPNLKAEMTRDPTLLAVLDLWGMRKEVKGVPQPPKPDLAAQREAFASAPELYGFLEAAYAYYADGDPKPVIKGVADDARRRGGDHLWFSRQMLRGQALERAGDRNARGFWKEMVPVATRPMDRVAIELALAINIERRGDIDAAFAPGAQIGNGAIRTLLLVNDAGSDLLRARASDPGVPDRERQAALFTLLRKQLTHGAYEGFTTDLALYPADATTAGSNEIDPLGVTPIPLGIFVKGKASGELACPRLTATAASLDGDPRATRPSLCLAEWMGLNGLDADPGRPKGAFGFGRPAFQGAQRTRSSIYLDVIADRGAAPDDRAYALYRAVKCYEPSGYNGCGGADAPKADRQRWFNALKREFAGSRWARGLRFWW